MKKISVYTIIMVLALAVAAQAATDLTIDDKQLKAFFTVTNGGTNGPVNENNTVTSGANTGQAWDMEAVVRNNSDLVLIGGWDWKNGLTDGGTTFRTGDLFLQFTNDPNTAVFGQTIDPTQQYNSYYQYDLAVRFDFVNNTFKVMTLDKGAGPNTGTLLTRVYDVYPNWGGTGNGDKSNPFEVTNFTGSNAGSIELGKGTYGLGYLGADTNSHNTLVLKNFYLYDGIGDLDGLFGHITMSCGNDQLAFFDATPSEGVPLPGAALLMGAGLARLVAYARKRRVTA